MPSMIDTAAPSALDSAVHVLMVLCVLIAAVVVALAAMAATTKVPDVPAPAPAGQVRGLPGSSPASTTVAA